MANINTNKKVGKVKESLSDMAGTADADHEVQMARAQLYSIAEYAIKLHDLMKTLPDTYDLESWQQAKITKAADYMDAVYHNLEYKLKSSSGGELGAALPGEIAVGEGKVEKKKYGKMKETSDPYVRRLRSQLIKKKTTEGRFDNRSGGVMGGPAKRDQMGKDIAYDTKDDFKSSSINTAKKMSKMGTHYMLINDKLWKRDGKPVEFKDFAAAGKASSTIRKKYPDKKVQITTKPTEPNA
jgi:hypothetical protein